MNRKIQFQESVYTYQIDFNRHVSNIVYIQWMEIGRLKLLEAVGMPVHTIDEQGFAPVLIETQVRYKRPLFLGDTVDIKVWLSEITRLHAWMEFSFHTPDGKLAARGRQRGLFVDLHNQRPMRLNQEQLSVFLPFVKQKD